MSSGRYLSLRFLYSWQYAFGPWPPPKPSIKVSILGSRRIWGRGHLFSATRLDYSGECFAGECYLPDYEFRHTESLGRVLCIWPLPFLLVLNLISWFVFQFPTFAHINCTALQGIWCWSIIIGPLAVMCVLLAIRKKSNSDTHYSFSNRSIETNIIYFFSSPYQRS